MTKFQQMGVIALLIGCGGWLTAADPPKGQPVIADAPTRITANAMTANGTVQIVNPTTRELKIAGSDGTSLTLKVSPDLGPLQNIKQGEQVQIKYLEPVIVALQNAGAGAAVPVAKRSIEVTPAQ